MTDQTQLSRNITKHHVREMTSLLTVLALLLVCLHPISRQRHVFILLIISGFKTGQKLANAQADAKQAQNRMTTYLQTGGRR